MRRQGAKFFLPLVFALVQASALDAQESCDGLPVRRVEVDANRPAFRGVLAWWRRAARAIGLHHENTSEGLIRRFVILEPGKPCTEFRRSESERILRAQPFIADATVRTRRVGDSVDVWVSTIDEVPVVAGGRVRGASAQAVSLGTMNLAGSGMHVETRWENGRALRDGYGGRISHPQLFGHPYLIVLDGMRRPLGEYYTFSVSHPFLTDLQRIAWATGYATSKDFAPLRKTEDILLVQPVDRSMWHVGGVLRFGPPGQLGLVGGMVLGDRVVTRGSVGLIDSAGFLQPAPDTTGVGSYPLHDETNLAGVLGVRALRFARVAGLDALEAEQDVATGFQVGTIFGVRPTLSSPFARSFAALDVYAGGRRAPHFVAMRIDVQSRLDLQNGTWRHLVGGGRAAWYVQPNDRWVSELSVDGVGVWRSIMPFQLELGDRRSGARGFAGAHEAGAQRVVGRLEQRVDLARYQDTRAAIGAAAFMDAGRVWRGDAPFGVTTPFRSSVGVALLAAVPAQSRRTLRAELALPITKLPGAGLELRFTVGQPALGFWSEPPRSRWARLSAVPEQIFSWP